MTEEKIHPFSILNTKTKAWKERRKVWKEQGFKDVLGRDKTKTHFYNVLNEPYISSFDPVIAECAFKWFAKTGDTILDPFCGGVSKGFVASVLGLHYTGIDIRQEQITANIEQCHKLPDKPVYMCGDSEEVLRDDKNMYDILFSCPPYYNLEVYSSLEDDLSNAPSYNAFIKKYSSILSSACKHLRIGAYAIFVVGDIRDSKGYYYGFVKDTIDIFQKNGLGLWDEFIIVQPDLGAKVRLPMFEKSKKNIHIHQYMLVFAKQVDKKNSVRKKLTRFAKSTGRDYSELEDIYSKML